MRDFEISWLTPVTFSCEVRFSSGDDYVISNSRDCVTSNSNNDAVFNGRYWDAPKSLTIPIYLTNG